MIRIYILLLSLVFFTVNFISICNAAILEQEIKESYINSDYKKTTKLLEQQVNQLTEKASKGERISFSDLYRKMLFLAHIYAWKLNKPDSALTKYQKVNALRQSSEEIKKSPPFEFLYTAEIYEMKKDFSKAREYYQDFLKELAVIQEKENDDISILMGDELTKFVKYQIDGINLKDKTTEKLKPLLPKLKLSSSLTSSALYPFLTVILVPTAEYDFAIASKTYLADYIKQSPTNLNSVILNYMLIVNASASSVDESSEKAIEAYLLKYPESYHSLLLGYMFYKFYKENEQYEKAEKLLRELKKIARKRGIEIVTDPDKRFSSPENTWDIYKKAFIEGDIETVKECYVPGGGVTIKAFREIGKEQMKEIGETMGNIQKITGNEESAKYRIKKKEKFKDKEEDITYYIYFQNIDGEWKMQAF
jgi:tetratricopeptide (TPR) repeat protein